MATIPQLGGGFFFINNLLAFYIHLMYNCITKQYIYITNTLIMTKPYQIRIDEKLKRDSEKILAELGLDVSTAMRMFLHQVVATQSIPFTIRKNLTENGFTPEFEKEILEAEKSESIGPFNNAKEAIKALHKLSKS